eukprot:TRINITY_DN10874_c0_g1_i1.p1 TRINITY_DN10874_c0_g1~~TRINITY_DN10874_c0_g1_i1.p1  ORF type:complete len:1370 (+),score=474.79 TRINITY_DN10874_c0_g1_i1:88-4197(+)
MQDSSVTKSASAPQLRRGPKWLWDQGKGEVIDGIFSGRHFPHRPGGGPAEGYSSTRRRKQDDAALVEEQQERIKKALTAVKDPETKAWTLRPRTKLEERELAAAKARQRANMTQKQVVWGREFTGSPFLASPGEVLFENFEVKREEVRTIRLTNVSFTFNSFKLLELAPQIADFFEITYTRPGRMSAGMYCEITVRFSPKLNEDVDTVIPFMAETGEFSVPLRATTKKVDVSVAITREAPGGARALDWGGSKMDFGGVQFAKTATRSIIVRNSGALAAKFDLTGNVLARLALAEHRAKGDIAARPLQLRPEKTESIFVPPQGSIELAFTYAPMRPEDELDPPESQPPRLDLRFSAHATGLKDFFFTLHGRGMDVPVYVADHCRVIDMRCCYFGTLYREELVLRNRGKTSMRVQPEVPPALKPYLDFVPRFGFIQPADPRDGPGSDPQLLFQMKWRPQVSMLRECAKYLSTDGQRLCAKLHILVPDQALPVHWELRCVLTKPLLELTPARKGRPRLDFGPVTVGEAAALTLSVTNTALLPVRVGFVSLPKEISVRPASLDIPLHWQHPILPQATESFQVVLRPTSAQPFKETVTLRTERNDDYSIVVTGRGREPPLCLSESVVKLPATAIGDVATVTLLLHNTSKQVQVFEFDLGQDPGGLSVSPSCGEIAPGGAEPLLIEFRAADAAEAAAAAEAEMQQKAAAAAALAAEREEQGISAEDVDDLAADGHARDPAVWSCSFPGAQWSRHRATQLRCYYKGSDQIPLFLEVHQCIVLPTLVADVVRTAVPAEPSAPAEDPKKGAKPAGKRAKTPDKPPGKPGGKRGRGSVAAEELPEPPPQQPADEPPPDPAADPDAFLVWHATRAAKLIDFGSIPALKEVTRTLTIRNVGQVTTNPTVKALDPFGPFTVIKPPAPLKPGHVCEVVIEFKAATSAVYREDLVLCGVGVNQVIVPMRGTGLTPELHATLGPSLYKYEKMPVTVDVDGKQVPIEVEALEPSESVLSKLPEAGERLALTFQGKPVQAGEVLQQHGVQKDSVLVAVQATPDAAPKEHTQVLSIGMGCMLSLSELKKHPGHFAAGEVRKRSVTLLNKSPFDVPFSISFLAHTVEPFNHRGNIPFSCTPSRGVIPAGATRDVMCHFQADHDFEHFRADAVCEYGGAGCSVCMRFHGSAFSQGVYARLPGSMRFSEPVQVVAGQVVPDTSLRDDPSAVFAALRLPGGCPAAPLQQKALIEFTPTFGTDGNLVRPVHHCIHVGNVGKGDGKGAAAGEVQLELFDPKEPGPPKQSLLGFEVSPPGGKVVLPPGEEKIVVVTFAPSDAAALRERELPVDGVGITVEATLKLTLRGGFPQPPADRSVITVTLKGNIRIPTSY